MHSFSNRCEEKWQFFLDSVAFFFECLLALLRVGFAGIDTPIVCHVRKEANAKNKQSARLRQYLRQHLLKSTVPAPSALSMSAVSCVRLFVM